MTITVKHPTVEVAVTQLCLRAGLTAGQFDASALSSITRPVQGLAISQIAPSRQVLELLMSTHFFEMTLSDKIYFIPRGGSVVVTVPYLELGASESDGEQEPLPLKQSNELEIPAEIALTYINVDNDYQTDTQYSDRLISAAEGTTNAVQIAIGMTPGEAKLVVDAMLQDQSVSRFSTSISLLCDYCALEPTDPINVLDAAGDTFRVRLVKKRDAYPVMTFDAVFEDISVLTSPAVVSGDYNSSTEVIAVPGTLMLLLDIPILLDADNDAGFYVAAKGDTDAAYSGAAVLNSPSGVTYTRQGTVFNSAVFGECTTILNDWSGPRVFDEASTVTVDVGNGTLSSSTRAALLNDSSINAALVGDEIIQFRTATLSAPGIYVLSGLLRGSRGTERAMAGHMASERFVLFTADGFTRVVLDNSALGLSYYYKGVTFDQPISSATPETFTDTAVGLKPFSPIDARGARNLANDLTITWQRRSRLSVREIGALGINVPLGEQSEAYEVDIYSDIPHVVVRTISTTSPAAAYSAADQTTDGFTPGDPINFIVYQISATVGRGFPLEQTA